MSVGERTRYGLNGIKKRKIIRANEYNRVVVTWMIFPASRAIRVSGITTRPFVY